VPVLAPVDLAPRADAVAQVMALALRVVVAVVPAAVAIFYAVTRRMRVADGVFSAATPDLARLPQDWAERLVAPGFTDPFTPLRVADLSASVIHVDDLASRDAFAYSSYGRFLARYGLDDQVALYVRASGAIVGAVALMRGADVPAFEPRELMLLRRLQPLLEHVYVQAREPGLATDRREALAMASLTPREAEVAQLVAGGSTNAEISRALHLSLPTVKTHVTQIFAKLGVRNRTQLAILLGPPD
jgi:DNA-binding CsgD family transcriptional regulator